MHISLKTIETGKTPQLLLSKTKYYLIYGTCLFQHRTLLLIILQLHNSRDAKKEVKQLISKTIVNFFFEKLHLGFENFLKINWVLMHAIFCRTKKDT